MQKIKVSPSLLSCDFARLGEEIAAITQAGADYIHFDVMDGHFVPNITIGPEVIKAARKHSQLTFDVHLMINNPEKYIEKFAESGSDIITIHQEAVTHLDRAIAQIHACKKKAGISIVPSTPETSLEYVIDQLDLILVMTVNPGFGGQKFLDGMLKKITKIRNMIDKSGRSIDLQVDGGINDQTAKYVIEAGANVLVAGSYIFSGNNYKEKIESLRKF